MKKLIFAILGLSILLVSCKDDSKIDRNAEMYLFDAQVMNSSTLDYFETDEFFIGFEPNRGTYCITRYDRSGEGSRVKFYKTESNKYYYKTEKSKFVVVSKVSLDKILREFETLNEKERFVLINIEREHKTEIIGIQLTKQY